MTSRSSVATARTLPASVGLEARCARPRPPRRVRRRESRPATRGSGAARPSACPSGSRVGELAEDLDVALDDVRGSLELGLARRSSSSSAGSTTTSAPASSPSSPSSVDVHAACTGPRRPRTTISRIPEETIASIAASVVSVGASSSRVSASMRATSSATLPFPMTTARSCERSNSRLLEVGVAVVPGDELGRGPRAGELLARDPELAVGLRARPRRSPRRTARRARRA